MMQARLEIQSQGWACLLHFYFNQKNVEWEKAPWVMVGIQWCHPPYCLGVKCMCMCMVLSTELAKEMLSNNASHASV